MASTISNLISKIGSAVSAVSPIAGAATALISAGTNLVSGAKANNEVKDSIKTRLQDNDKWYAQNAPGNFTKKSYNQALLKQQQDLLGEQYKNARATNTVAGGSDASLAAQQAKANQSLENTATNIAANASSYDENVQNQYRQTKDNLLNQEAQLAQQKANNIAQAAGQGISSGLGLMVSGMGNNSDSQSGTGTGSDFDSTKRLNDIGIKPVSSTLNTKMS